MIYGNNIFYIGHTNNLAQLYETYLDEIENNHTNKFISSAMTQSWSVKGDDQVALKIKHYINTLEHEDKIEVLIDPSSLVERFRKKLWPLY